MPNVIAVGSGLPGSALRPWRILIAALRARIASHPMVIDTMIALLLLAVFHRRSHVVAAWWWLLELGLVLPLALRRRAPLSVFCVIATFAYAQWVLGEISVVNFGLLIALYTVAAFRPWRYTLFAVCIAEFGAGLISQRWASSDHGARTFIVLSSMITAATVIGINIRTRRAYLSALEDRAARLERERDQQAQLAAADERSRIAREMHDVVAHSLSVMVVLADGAALTVQNSPGEEPAKQAGRAMLQVASTGRQAITEMRRLLGVLREDGLHSARQPQPGLDQLDALLEQVRAAGLPVQLVVLGEAFPVPAGAQLTIYRLIQEALTNTRKHAGAGASACVRLCYIDGGIDVQITDDGGTTPIGAYRNQAHELSTEAVLTPHGIMGMRERAAVYGGHVQAEPLPDRGWRVHTVLELKPETEAQ